MATDGRGTIPRRIAIVGGGISGLAAAWGLRHHSDRFDFRLFEAQDRIGGNAVTADMPQDDGSSIPFDISVTACIPSVYQHIVLLMKQFGIELIDTRFSYSVKYRGHVYAHDFDSEIREQLQSEIAKFQRVLRRLHWDLYTTVARLRLLLSHPVRTIWCMSSRVQTFRLAASLIYLFRFIQGKRRTRHCGAHTLINSQETCFVSGLAAATQIGADYPFGDSEARRSFNHYGSLMYGWRFKKAKG